MPYKANLQKSSGPDVEVYYVRTGIGKVKSAFHLSEAIQQVKPDIVINQGTAGTINHQVGDVFCLPSFCRSGYA